MGIFAEQTPSRIKQYWSEFLGCTPTHFEGAQTVVVAHSGLGDYHGIYCFCHRYSLLISAPSPMLPIVRERAASLVADDIEDVARLSPLGDAVERVVGPAMIAYADAATFRPLSTSTARLLDADDQDALERLRAACLPFDWEHGGSEDGDMRAGVFVGDTLTAIASYSVWGGALAHLAIVTHPQYRGQGFGTAAVSVLADYALQQGLIAQYRTLRQNTASISIAKTLGFVPWATTVALRLQPMDQPPRA